MVYFHCKIFSFYSRSKYKSRKKSNMFKYLLIISLLIVQNAFAQQNTGSPRSPEGMVVYQQKIKMSSAAIQRDTLKFNRSQSIFHWNLYSTSDEGLSEAKKKYPNAKVVKVNRVGNGQITFFDTAKDSIFSRMSMSNIEKLLYLKEKAPKLDWSITDSTKTVGNYTTQKATVYFRGRDYTAWFTPEIPVPYGPWKLHGLPGLILQAYDQTGNIYFSATDISLKEVGPIGPISMSGNEETISLAEYKEITKNYEKYQKQKLLKMVKSYLSEKELAKMTFKTQPVRQMEIFDENK